MITTTQADEIIRRNHPSMPAAPCPLAEAHGRILREDIAADRDIPPYDRVMMDGIAIRFEAWQQGRTSFPVEKIQPAGQAPVSLDNPDACIQIMTGAVLPTNCDCVIPIEQVELSGTIAALKAGVKPEKSQFIHRRASDHPKGALLLKSGTLLQSPHIAVAASVGRSSLLTGTRPSIAILSNGDELVDVGKEVESHQIRPSNAYGIQAALKSHGFDNMGVYQTPDNRQSIVHSLREALRGFDVLVLSGGVSMGKFDFVPLALGEMGVAPLFHKVNQKPGKPLWFGQSVNSKIVFALPGNPVSCLVCLYRYVLPALWVAMGQTDPQREWITLSQPVHVEKAMTCFVPCCEIKKQDGSREAEPRPFQNSGDYTALAGTDGFVELPEGALDFPAGAAVQIYRWS
ncbi:MAG: molybdopterin molybdotransferase MoeA [Lentisphaerota bacterium]